MNHKKKKKALLPIWIRCISRKLILSTHFIFKIEEVSTASLLIDVSTSGTVVLKQWPGPSCVGYYLSGGAFTTWFQLGILLHTQCPFPSSAIGVCFTPDLIFMAFKTTLLFLSLYIVYLFLVRSQSSGKEEG